MRVAAPPSRYIGRVNSESAPVTPVTDWITYFGTFTQDSSDAGSVGIYVTRLNGATGRIERIGEVEGLLNPSFLAIHPNERFMYVVSEHDASAEVLAMAIDRVTGMLTPLNEQGVPGRGACHVSVDPQGHAAYVANYGSGNAARLPILDDGTLGPAHATPPHVGSGPDAIRQETAHAHSITPCPKGEHFYVADLGIDGLMAYELDLTSGRLVAVDELHLPTEPGAGPRHFTFHPHRPYAYLLNELNSTIDVMRFDGASGRLTRLQTVSTLPSGFTGTNLTAEVVLHPGGRWLYASNRGHNSLALFEVSVDGLLTPRDWASTRGDHPRNFNITPDGRWLVVANMFDSLAVVFAVDAPTGALAFTTDYRVPRPSRVEFLAATN